METSDRFVDISCEFRMLEEFRRAGSALPQHTTRPTLDPTLFGTEALETDRTTRVFGFDRLGRTDYDQASPLARSVIDAYTAGVNAFLTQPKLRLPVEYKLIGHRPEPWAAADTMAFTRFMMWQLSHAWYGEIVRAQVIEAVGAERAADLEVHYPPGNPVTLPKGIEFNRQAATGGLPGTGGRECAPQEAFQAGGRRAVLEKRVSAAACPPLMVSFLDSPMRRAGPTALAGPRPSPRDARGTPAGALADPVRDEVAAA